MTSERLSRALAIGTRVTLAMNATVIVGGLIAGVFLIVAGEAVGRVILYCIGGVTMSLALWFILPFGLTYAFPPPSDRLEFPGARRVIWPLVGLATLATMLLVLRK
jgi:hypothetical protein